MRRVQGVRAAEKRYDFRFPPAYRALLDAGLLKARGADALQLTDLEWLTPTQIAGYEAFLPSVARLVPFATTARVDEWCWRLDWADRGEPAVVFRERGGPAFGYAPDFCGFLYRVLLEELSGSWLVEGPDDARGQAIVRRSVEAVAPHLPTPWSKRLRSLAGRPWVVGRDGEVGVFRRAECDRIVAKALAFPHLDKEAAEAGDVPGQRRP